MDKVLIIDDSRDYRILLRQWLSNDFVVIEAFETKDAIEQIEEEKPDCLLLDCRLPKEDGFLFLHRLSKHMDKMPAVLLISGVMEESLRRNALALGASECAEKNELTKEKLVRMIPVLIAQKRAA